MRTPLTLLAFTLMSAICFLVGIAVMLDKEKTLFSLHPLLMTISICFFLPYGIIVFKAKRYDVDSHANFQFLSLLAFCGGFYAIYETKNSYKREHFTTWHGQAGVAAVAALIGVTVFGTLIRYVLKGKLFRSMHRLGGRVVYVLASAAMTLGLLSSWSTKSTLLGHWVTRYFILGASVVLPLVVLVLASLSVKPKAKTQ
eukprot:GILI01013538.1.p1 GENE.GILI01013538.1~~GILI01013538.1.p1  ORF type:complete len:199 (-),score=33.56 GILI01013538.1:81-677(-)